MHNMKKFILHDSLFIGALSFMVLELVLAVMWQEDVIGRSMVFIISVVFWAAWYAGRAAARKAWGPDAQ
jgi:hypothetical protein